MTTTRPTIALQRAIALVLAGAALVSLFLLLAAKAEANNDKTYFTVTAGALEFVTAPALPVLTGVTLNGEAQNTHTNMTPTVTRTNAKPFAASDWRAKLAVAFCA